MAPTSQSTKNIVYIPYDINIDINKALGEYIFEALQKYSKNIAQIDTQTGKTETYGQLLKRCISLAQALKTKGVTTDDIVGLCSFNNMDYIAIMIASAFLGARFSSLDVTGSKSEIIHCLKLTKPVVMFCAQEREDLFESAIKEAGINCEIIIFDKSDKYITMDNFVEKFKSNEEFKVNTSGTLNDTASIGFTSGTSGISKGAQISSFGLYYGGIIAVRAIPEVQTCMVCTLPYWISNISFCMLAILNGIGRVIERTYNFKTVVKTLSEFKVGNTILTQHGMNDLIKNPEVCQYDTSSLKYIFFAGSKIGVQLIAEMRKLFPQTKFINIFGITEMAGVVCQGNEVIDAEDNYSAGSATPGIHYKIVDPNTEETLGPHMRGELRIKYDGIFKGYLHQPEVTAQAFDEDGYFKTGDLVYYDEKFNFFITGRLKEIFKFQGQHISPTVIEDILALHPDVKDCAVIPVPHEHDGEIPMGIIKLNENAKVTEQEIIQFTKERLADRYHLRGGVQFVNSIPRTSTGKVLRNQLKDLILNKK